MHHDQRFPPIILENLNAEWEKCLAMGVPKRFAAGACFSDAGSFEPVLDEGMYYIRKGLVRLSQRESEGRHKIMLYLGRKVFFNEVPMLQRSDGYVFTCMEETESVFLPKRLVVGKLLKEDDALRKNLLASMSRKSMFYHRRIKFGQGKDALSRVCRALCSMRIHNSVGEKVAPRLTQRELADYLNLHRRTVQRVLARLQEEGVMSPYSCRGIEIYDQEKLLAFSGMAEEQIQTPTVN